MNAVAGDDRADTVNGLVGVIPGNGYMSPATDVEVQFYDDAFLAYQTSHPIPSFHLGGAFYSGHGRFVFFDSAGTEYYVVIQADPASGALYDFAVVRSAVP